MSKMEVHPIGRITCEDGEFRVVLSPEYAPAMKGLEGFSHVQVIWWFDRAPQPLQQARVGLECSRGVHGGVLQTVRPRFGRG